MVIEWTPIVSLLVCGIVRYVHAIGELSSGVIHGGSIVDCGVVGLCFVCGALVGS